MDLIRVTRHLIDAYKITDQEAVGLARYLLQLQLKGETWKLEDRGNRDCDLLGLETVNNEPADLEWTAHDKSILWAYSRLPLDQ